MRIPGIRPIDLEDCPVFTGCDAETMFVSPRAIESIPSVTMKRWHAEDGEPDAVEQCQRPGRRRELRRSRATLSESTTARDHPSQGDDRSDRQIDAAGDDHQRHAERRDGDDALCCNRKLAFPRLRKRDRP